ncbi:MAG: hypothetical protein KY476_25320, partial [Planctomycetes bacterium]|nr:hypothetical protein [Planctomycetota bacterium]
TQRSTAAELEKYDVVVAFDPDWKRMQAEQPESIELLRKWVYDRKGGLVLVAGDVFTPELAAAGDELEDVLAMYPVFLSNFFLDVAFDSERQSEEAWQPLLTPDGQAAGFLQVAEDAEASRDLWSEFEGFYRAYPTEGKKAGATVYMYHTDTTAQTEHGRPVLLAAQDYGEGTTFYIGSAELWRLRAYNDEYYDRFWTKLIREAGQGRRKQGDSPVTLLPEKTEVNLGETVKVTAVVLDNNYQPTTFDSVELDVIDPRGRPQVPSRKLFAVKTSPGEYLGDFRATQPGKYELRLPLPGSEKYQSKTVTVVFPGVEKLQTEQNASLLTEIARDTGGRYVALDEASGVLVDPDLLPVRVLNVPQEQKLETLWDRQWILFALVGLLSMEWLTRKLLKLA